MPAGKRPSERLPTRLSVPELENFVAAQDFAKPENVFFTQSQPDREVAQVVANPLCDFGHDVADFVSPLPHSDHVPDRREHESISH